MNLNYIAFFLISFVPLIIGFYWYHPKSIISKWSGQTFQKLSRVSLIQILVLFILSIGFVYGYMNLIIHQLGFYELFFTDIMLGSEEAEIIVKEFLSSYGDKHRHFGHGVLHGVINACLFSLPFISAIAILDKKGRKYIIHHFSYWLITSALIGGLISAFV